MDRESIINRAINEFDAVMAKRRKANGVYILYTDSGGCPGTIGPFKTYLNLLEHLAERLDDTDISEMFYLEIDDYGPTVRVFGQSELDGTALMRLRLLMTDGPHVQAQQD